MVLLAPVVRREVFSTSDALQFAFQLLPQNHVISQAFNAAEFLVMSFKAPVVDSDEESVLRPASMVAPRTLPSVRHQWPSLFPTPPTMPGGAGGIPGRNT